MNTYRDEDVDALVAAELMRMICTANNEQKAAEIAGGKEGGK